MQITVACTTRSYCFTSWPMEGVLEDSLFPKDTTALGQECEPMTSDTKIIFATTEQPAELSKLDDNDISIT